MRAVDSFNAELRAAGRLRAAHGLADPSSALVVDNRAGVELLTEGPVHNPAEYLSGFWIIDADSPSHAREIALAASRACNRKVELRALLG